MTHEVESLEELEQKIQEAGTKLVVIHFYADRILPSRRMRPHLEEFAKNYKDKAVFVKIKAENYEKPVEDIIAKYGVTQMPAFYYVRKKTVLKRSYIGLSDDVEKYIKQYVT